MIGEQGGVSMGARVSRGGALYTLFLLISFFGWVLEEVFFFSGGHGIVDRGFLSLPICAVYGLGVILTYLSLGLPDRMRFFSFSVSAKTRKGKLLQALLYVLLSGIICSACELAVGLFLHRAFGIFMWDYRETPFHVGAYICLPYALIWGVLTYFFMRYAFLFFFRRLSLMRRASFLAIMLPISIFLLFDIAANVSYAFLYRAHMALW